MGRASSGTSPPSLQALLLIIPPDHYTNECAYFCQDSHSIDAGGCHAMQASGSDEAFPWLAEASRRGQLVNGLQGAQSARGRSRYPGYKLDSRSL